MIKVDPKCKLVKYLFFGELVARNIVFFQDLEQSFDLLISWNVFATRFLYESFIPMQYCLLKIYVFLFYKRFYLFYFISESWYLLLRVFLPKFIYKLWYSIAILSKPFPQNLLVLQGNIFLLQNSNLFLECIDLTCLILQVIGRLLFIVIFTFLGWPPNCWRLPSRGCAFLGVMSIFWATGCFLLLFCH